MNFLVRFVGLIALAGAASAQAQPFDKIGFFVGETTPAKAAPAYLSFVTLVHQTPNTTNIFVDYREPIWSAGTYDAKWRNNASWAAGNLVQLCSPAYLNRVDAEGRPTIVPLVSVGLTDDPTVYRTTLPEGHPDRGKYNEAAAIAMMNDVARGKYDRDDVANGRYRVWPAIFDVFRDKGFRKIYLRVGWEQNGNWYGWQVRNEATKQAYIAAWRHVADLAHSYAAANGMIIETVWSPSASYANFGVSEESSYPGDAYVDIIAPTAYSPISNPTRSRDRTAYHDWTSGQNVSLAAWLANPTNRRRVWDYPAADYWNPTRGWGIPAAINFALSHSKRFGLSETGTGSTGVATNAGGLIDEGDYPLYLGERLSAAMRQGLQLEMVEIWSQASGTDRLNFLSGSRPQEANGWRHLGAMLAAATSPVNLAAGKKASASSSISTTFASAKIVDSNTNTRWTSASGVAKQWVGVDLGQRYSISRVRVSWDAAYASEYSILTSLDNVTWTTLYTSVHGDGGVDDIQGLAGVGRIVRVVATKRGSTLGNYSMREVEIYP